MLPNEFIDLGGEKWLYRGGSFEHNRVGIQSWGRQLINQELGHRAVQHLHSEHMTCIAVDRSPPTSSSSVSVTEGADSKCSEGVERLDRWRHTRDYC